ncbi:TolC family protein [Mucilaginibacter celer]|uniref:Efflux transporter outer membrane subunit n=1 Tax=Mucilaginibacter celer TaxID=2305508 RepID=A0A494VTR6_9SPHI|nr:efflux transporter outer membrane subunit [Mucilaginibacter celer]AYL94332.1 efflux transporter outer membrane subunit [Mucilaginibacter celer]
MRTLMKYSIAATVLLTIHVMAGCKVSKDVTVPDMKLPVAFRDNPEDSVSIGALPWKSYFDDPELKTLIADAIDHNFDLQVAVNNIQAAELVLKQAKLGDVPSVGVGLSASSGRPSDNSLNGMQLNSFLGQQHIEDYSLAASLTWEADIWGKIHGRKEAALAGYLSTQEARKGVQTRIVSDISKGYYNLLMLDAQLRIAKNNVLLNDSTLSLVQLQYKSGKVSNLAIQQVEAQKLTAEALVPRFEQQIAVQENAISVLSGRLPNPVNRYRVLDSLVFAEKLTTGLPAELLKRRPDVRQAELALDKANAEVGVAKASLYPSLTINGQGGLDAIRASNWFNLPASLFGTVVGGIAQPLFDKKRLRTNFNVAKTDREITVIRFRQSVLTAYGEVSDALVKLDKLKQQQYLAAERTGTLQQATRNSQLLFKNGMATYLEVIIAESNVLQSQLELASIKKARLDATVDLYRSLGGGWN